MAAETAPCLLCNHGQAKRDRIGGDHLVHRCPACRHFETDYLFVVVGSKDDVSIPDAHILAGYARQQSESGEGPAFFRYQPHIFEAADRLKNGEPAHPDLLEFVPATPRDQAMHILKLVRGRSTSLIFGESVELDPKTEFTVCCARSSREFHNLVKWLEEQAYVVNIGDMHFERVRLTGDGDEALDSWLSESAQHGEVPTTQSQHAGRVVSPVEAYSVPDQNDGSEAAVSPDSAAEGRPKVFIGHGDSPIWRELKEFLVERLDLDIEEFNRVPTAGKTTIERLEEMLNSANFAFLVMTAEDEHVDGTVHPRENVVHEAGLFQGKLGFKRAIVLLQEDCKQFSNIEGLTQIRFPQSNIDAVFEEVRAVLEREGILPQTGRLAK